MRKVSEPIMTLDEKYIIYQYSNPFCSRRCGVAKYIRVFRTNH